MSAAVVEVLRRVRARLEKPGAWTTGAAARAGRIPVTPSSPRANCWCLIGAISAETTFSPEAFGTTRETLKRHAGLAETGALSGWNDDHKHHEVLALLDRAIAAEGGAQ